MKFTRKSYLELWREDEYISRHTSLVECAESAGKQEPGIFQVRIGSEIYYEIDMYKPSVDGLIVKPANPPVANSPPVWDSQPNLLFFIGTAKSYDMDDISSDPDADAITHSLNTGAVALPAGVTWTAGTGVLAYDGVGAVTTTTGHIFTLDDGNDTTDSNPVSIVISEIGTSSNLDNWPFLTCSRAIASVNSRLDTDPYKRVIEASNMFIHQGLYFTDSNARAGQKARFELIEQENPGIIWVMHISCLNVIFDVAGTIKASKFMEQVLYNNPAQFDDMLLRHSDGGFVQHAGTAKYGFAFRYPCSQANKNLMVDALLDDFTDDGGVYNLMPDHKLYYMQDVIPEKDSRYGRAGHFGTVTSAHTSTEINVPEWVDPEVTGTADGDGYFSLSGNQQKALVVLQSNGQRGDWSICNGYKSTGGGNGRFRITSSLENLNTSVNGAHFSLLADGTGYGSTTAGEDTDTARLQGIVDFMTTYEDRALAREGVIVGTSHNGAAATWTQKEQGNAPTYPSPFIGAWEHEEFERAGQTLGFFQASQATYHTVRQDQLGGKEAGANWDPTRFVSAVAYSKLMLKTDPADTASGYPATWMNWQARAPGPTSISVYDNLDETDHAFCLFGAVSSWCHDNCMPQLEADRANASHDITLMIAEQMISAGDPVSTRGFGTFDPEALAGVGEFTWRAADFGDYGYWFEFDNCLLFINLRKPDSDPWVPSYLSGGQSTNAAKDDASGWPSAGAGKKWQRFDSTTYVNPDTSSKFYNKGAADYAAAKPLTGPTQHDGTDLGSTVTIGPLECLIALRVDV